MVRWWLGPREWSPKETFAIELEIGEYRLCADSGPGTFFVSPRKDEALLVFGYILPRLDRNLSAEPAHLFRYAKEKGESWIEDFKGIFTVVVVRGAAIDIYNDQFGLSTFFYSRGSGGLTASNRLSLVKPYAKDDLDTVNMYQYMLLNYFMDGRTIYRDIRFADGGSFFRLRGGHLEKKVWFELESFLDHGSHSLSKNQIFPHTKELWLHLLRQYTERFSAESISLTLTAGLDSRMILAGLRHLGQAPETFTFGLGESMDVRVAKVVAGLLGLPHQHYYPGDEFFRQFSAVAPETVATGNSLVSLYRSHRMDTYTRLRSKSRAVFFGFAGSEVIRGLFPDRLILSEFVIDLWLNRDLDIGSAIRSHFNLAGLPLDEQLLEALMERIRGYDFLLKPDLYLFKVIIPLHFGQDVRMLEALDMVSLCPYWDLDYLELLKTTGFFIRNERKQDYARLGHFSRRQGPLFSSRIISLLDPQLARLDLGKGYSPLDMSRSALVSGLKFLLHKTLRGKTRKIPNFSYGQWYKDFLLNFFKEADLSYLGVRDNSRWLDAIRASDARDEFGFLTWTQLANIELARRIQL